MNNSISFDRAAGYYDQTRPLLEPIAAAGSQIIIDIAGPEAQILDVGTGTGRISIPLLERGVDLIGCDISARMLRRLHEKFPSARITQADAALLPFPTASFDVLITAHVLHLIPTWRQALREFQRVLKPGGKYLNLKTWEVVGTSIRGSMREFWRGWLETQGIDARLRGVRHTEEFRGELQTMDAQLSEVEVLHYPLQYTIREELVRFESRVYSDAWDVPDPIFELSLKELRAWTEREYGDFDQPREDEVRFSIDVAQFS